MLGTSPHALRVAHTLAAMQALRELSDRELLARFAGSGDEAAFTLLVERHAPTVHGVCARALRNPADADDAFQATFLVLARKAGTLRTTASVAAWLHGTAVRVAANLRREAARRERRERAAGERAAGRRPADLSWPEVWAALDEELSGLPDRYRGPLVLCYLDGLTRDEAARRLGLTVGALHGRLERGRVLLRTRLTRRGVALPTAFLVGGLGSSARGVVSPTLVVSAAKAAVAYAAGRPTPPGPVPARAVVLANGVSTMVGSKLKLPGLALALGVMALAGTLPLLPAGGQPPAAPTRPLADDPPPVAKSAPADALGDPLPPGALARLGSNRFHHGETVRRVFTSPDGRHVLSLSRTNEAWKAKLWEAGTGRAIPLAGGKLAGDEVLTAGRAGGGLGVVVRTEAGWALVDAESGATALAIPLPPAPQGGPKAYAPAVRPDGKAVAYAEAGNGYGVRVWQAGAKNPVEVVPPQPDHVQRLLFSPDGRRLAVQFWPDTGRPPGARGARTEVWDVAARKMLLATQVNEDEDRRVDQVFALSPDGKLFAKDEWGKKKRVRIWEVDGGKELDPLVWTTGDWCHAIAFAPDGKAVATALANERGYQIWDLPSRKQAGGIRGLGWDVWDVAWTPDGKRVVAAHGQDVTVRVAATGEPAVDLGHTGTVYGVSWSPDGKRVTTYDGKKSRAWDAATGRPIAPTARPGGGGPWAAETPDGIRAARADKDGTVLVWDTATGKELARLKTGDGKADTLATARLVALTADGRWLAAAGRTTVQVWDVEKAERVVSVQHGLSEVSGMWLAPDGKRVAAAGRVAGNPAPADGAGYALITWTVPGGEQSARLPLGGSVPEDLSADGRFLTCVAGGRVELRDVAARGRPYTLASADREAMFARFAPDGRTVAMGFRGPEVLVVEAASGGRRSVFDARVREVGFGAAFSPDGTRLATAAGRSVLVWDLSAAGGRNLPASADAAWADLADPDAAKGFAAVRYFAASPDEAAKLVGERVKPVPAADPKAVAEQIARLDAPGFADREAAQKWLTAAAAATDAARSQVRKALESTESPEAGRRLEAVLAGADGRPLRGDALRAVRAVEALERAGTPAARRALERLAGGASDARLTRDAASALRRLPPP